MDKQSVRNEFAQRLRELRVPRGFTTARSFARALEIDENRYTRYERAEVEPDLLMIRKICQVLDVTPCDLLLPQGATGSKRRAARKGNSRSKSGDGVHIDGADTHELGIATAAWDLASTIVAVRREGIRRNHGDGHATAPLDDIGEVAEVYRILMREPFETIGGFSQEAAFREVGVEAAHSVRSGIERLVQALRQSTGR